MLTPTGVTAAAYWSAIKDGNPTHIRMTFTGQNIVLEDADIAIDGMTINDIFNGDTDLVFGKAIAKQVTVSILNSSKLTDLVWTGEFTLEMGVDIGTPAVTNWVTIGLFSGEKPNNVTTVNVIEFTAYDRMKNFDILADKFVESITYPTTVQDIYDDLCTFVGISNIVGDELPNIMSRSYASAPVDMTGYTCRDLLGIIAEACGCYAKANENGEIVMKWFTDNTAHSVTGNEEFNIESGDIDDGMTWDEADTYTWDNFDNFTWNDVCGYQEIFKIDQIQVQMLSSNIKINYPYDYGGNVYTIVDNPFLSYSSASDIANYIAPLYNRMDTFGGYITANIECIGCWLVEAGDIISVEIKGNSYNIPIFVKTMRWNGAINDSYETTGNKERYAYNTENDKQQIIANKYIRLFVKDNYYKTQSGIDITADGVSIVGNKYVLIQATDNYRWLYNNIGITLRTSGSEWFDKKFWLGEDQYDAVRNSMTAFGFHNRSFSDSYGASYVWHEITLLHTFEQDGIPYGYPRLIWGGGKNTNGSAAPSFFPYEDNFYWLGDGSHSFNRVYAYNICGRHTNSVYGRIRFYPYDADDQTRVDLISDNYNVFIRKTGTSSKTLVFEGTLVGGIKAQDYASETELNNIDSPGMYMVNFSSSTLNKPSGIPNGGYIIEVFWYSNDIVIQIIYTTSIIYMRERRNNVWGIWYKFTGTAV